MAKLTGKNVVVLGASGGVGSAIVRNAESEGARTLVVARGLSYQAASSVLQLDATTDNAPRTVFQIMRPDVLVICGGARPPTGPIHELSWAQFSATWETDVKMTFQFCRAALIEPLAHGSVVILISSGAAIGGSPISGGYAGAKRTQMFIANYAQKESDRLNLGIRFIALAPAMIMPDTPLGRSAISAYAQYLGVSPEDFVRSMKSPQTPNDVANAVVQLATAPNAEQGNVFTVSAQGLSKVT